MKKISAILILISLIIFSTAYAAAPDAITDLVALESSNQVDLTWSAPIDGGSEITDYEIHFSTDQFENNDQIFAGGISAQTTATVTGLTDFTEYSFQVFAINNDGRSSESNVATVITNPCGPLDNNLDGPNGKVTSGECIQTSITRGDLNFTQIPESFSFPQAPSISNNQIRFSNPGGQTDDEDIYIVEDLRYNGGFTVNISATPFSNGTDLIPLENLYIATSYPASVGTETNGVEYATGSKGLQNIIAPLHTTGAVNDTTSYTANFSSAPLTLMDATNIQTEPGRVAAMSQALNFYINISADQPTGTYEVVFTLDLIGS